MKIPSFENLSQDLYYSEKAGFDEPSVTLISSSFFVSDVLGFFQSAKQFMFSIFGKDFLSEILSNVAHKSGIQSGSLSWLEKSTKFIQSIQK